jgi:hypothetical protein
VPDRSTIRGYGGVFRRDWRIYSVPDGKGGRKPLPVTGGLPMRAVLYAGVVWALVFLVERLPVIGLPLHVFDWPIRYIAIPGIVAFVLTKAEPDGRPAVRYLGTWLAHRLTARCRSAGRPVPAEGEVSVFEPHVAIASDGEGPTLVCGQVRGPARVEFLEPVVVTPQRRRRRYVARPFAGDRSLGERDTLATSIDLERGESVQVVS